MSTTAMNAPARHARSGPSKDMQVAAALGRRRKRRDRIMLWLALAATAIGLAFLVSILATLLWRGTQALSFEVFTDVTRPPGS
jgi:phosphate transport system permease protein